MRYVDKLSRRIAAAESRLCVGLDPRFDLITGDPFDFLRRVIVETEPFAAAFKPNIAFFEQTGSRGIALLERVFETIRELAPEVPIVLDAKRSDIGETQQANATACFRHFQADAVTLNPYLGFDTIEPFLDFPGRGVYLLAVTSNPGAAEFALRRAADGRFLFEHIQAMVERAAGRPTDVGLVVGLTNISDEIWQRLDDRPLLVPGLGVQGGEIARLAASAGNQPRRAPILVNVSRGILFADAEVSFGGKARRWRDAIR
jgi:orotidine-5'-phosphate decarboxylase